LRDDRTFSGHRLRAPKPVTSSFHDEWLAFVQHAFAAAP
jgi:hypothetical protein